MLVRRWLLLSISFLILAALISGCTAATPSPTPPPTGQPTAVPTAAPTKPPVQPGTPTPKPATPAPSGPPYYQGKTIEIVAATAPGGGTDTSARAVAAYLPRHIPGNPKIIVRNQAGAGGVVATNSFYAKAKPDGLTLIHGSDTLIGAQQRRRDIVQYDLLKMVLIGNMGGPGPVFAIRKDALKRLKDPSAPACIVGTREGEEAWEVIPLLGKEFLGWNIRWVPGYGGTSEIVLAVRRGEVDMFGDSQNIKLLVEEGVMEPLAQVGVYQGGKFVRRADFSQVPTFEEVLGDKKPTGIPWQGFLCAVGPAAVFKWTAAPPGTPDNVSKILIDAYAALKQDREAMDMLTKSFAEVFEISAGKDTESLMRAAVEAPPEAVDYIEGLLKKFGVKK